MKLCIAFGIAAVALAPMSAAAAPCTKNCPKPAVGGVGKGGVPGLKGGLGGGLFKPGGGGGSPFGGRSGAGTGGGQGGLVRGGQGGLVRGGQGSQGSLVRGGHNQMDRGGRLGGRTGGLYARGGAPLRATDGRSYMFHGRRYGAFRAARFHWRHGYGYRSYGIGYVFPFASWPSEYYISDYGDYGLDAPPPGYWWIRNGPDLLLVNIATGVVAQDVSGAIEEDAGPGPDDSGGPPPDGGYDDQQDQGPGPGDDQQANGYGPPQDGDYGPPPDAGPPPPPPPPPCHGFWCAVQSTIQNATCNSLPGGCPPPDGGPPPDQGGGPQN